MHHCLRGDGRLCYITLILLTLHSYGHSTYSTYITLTKYSRQQLMFEARKSRAFGEKRSQTYITCELKNALVPCSGRPLYLPKGIMKSSEHAPHIDSAINLTLITLYAAELA